MHAFFFAISSVVIIVMHRKLLFLIEIAYVCSNTYNLIQTARKYGLGYVNDMMQLQYPAILKNIQHSIWNKQKRGKTLHIIDIAATWYCQWEMLYLAFSLHSHGIRISIIYSLPTSISGVEETVRVLQILLQWWIEKLNYTAAWEKEKIESKRKEKYIKRKRKQKKKSLFALKKTAEEARSARCEKLVKQISGGFWRAGEGKKSLNDSSIHLFILWSEWKIHELLISFDFNPEIWMGGKFIRLMRLSQNQLNVEQIQGKKSSWIAALKRLFRPHWRTATKLSREWDDCHPQSAGATRPPKSNFILIWFDELKFK